jgi:hypothetical protein
MVTLDAEHLSVRFVWLGCLAAPVRAVAELAVSFRLSSALKLATGFELRNPRAEGSLWGFTACRAEIGWQIEPIWRIAKFGAK